MDYVLEKSDEEMEIYLTLLFEAFQKMLIHLTFSINLVSNGHIYQTW